jgi:hypothetical protein
VPRGVDVLCGAIGVFLLALVVVSGLAGTPTAAANFADTFIYVTFWVGLVVVSLLLGNVFGAFNPWLALARAGRWAWRRAGRTWPDPLPYPARLGRWPAVAGIACFAWLELIAHDRTDPRLLAILALVYALVQLAGMGLYGIEAWTERGDAFAVYFGLFGRLAPLRRVGREVRLRPPLAGAPALSLLPGTVALVCLMIGTTSYDGLESTTLWSKIDPHLQNAFSFLGSAGAEEAAGTIGLMVMIALVAVLYLLGVEGMRTVGGGTDGADLARRFVHTLIPIAAAYVVAHYFSFLVFNGQALAALASDPLGSGANLFGTAGWNIDYNVISGAGIWYVQVAALITGHVGGLVLAHDRAVSEYRNPREATRSQHYMLAVMVGFTSLALWLLASINA